MSGPQHLGGFLLSLQFRRGYWDGGCLWGFVCVCVGFWGDPGGHGDFREMERGMDILGWCFCEWEVESRKRGRTGWNWEGVPLPRVLSVHRAGLTEVSLPGHFSHTAHPLSCSWAR